MRRLFGLLAALAATLAVSPALAQEAASSGEATLTVEGQATVSRAPEIATVSVGFTTNSATAAEAQSHNNTIYDAVLAALHRIGLGDAAIKTASYSMSYNPPPTPAPGVSEPNVIRVRPGDGYGYVVNRQLNVTAAPDGVGRVIDASSAAGATEIGGISFGLRDRRAAWTSALAAAIADADKQANSLAATGRFRVVRLKSIQAGPAPYVPGPMMAMRMAAPATTIPSSDVEVSASVTVTYVISP